MTSAPIIVNFVEVVRTDWVVVLAIFGMVIALVSSMVAREYQRPVRLPRRPGVTLFEAGPPLLIEPDPQVVKVGRVYRWVARLGLLLAASAVAIRFLS